MENEEEERGKMNAEKSDKKRGQMRVFPGPAPKHKV